MPRVDSSIKKQLKVILSFSSQHPEISLVAFLLSNTDELFTYHNFQLLWYMTKGYQCCCWSWMKKVGCLCCRIMIYLFLLQAVGKVYPVGERGLAWCNGGNLHKKSKELRISYVSSTIHPLPLQKCMVHGVSLSIWAIKILVCVWPLLELVHLR